MCDHTYIHTLLVTKDPPCDIPEEQKFRSSQFFVGGLPSCLGPYPNSYRTRKWYKNYSEKATSSKKQEEKERKKHVWLSGRHLLRGGYKRGLHAFEGGRRHHGRFGIPEEEKGAGGRGEATARESVLATPLWGMLYADDAGVVSRSPEQLRKMMEMIVVVCAAFGLTISEANIETMCLRAKGMPESTATFSLEATGQVYNRTNEFVYLGGNVHHNADLSTEVDRRIRNVWCSFRKYTLELYDRPSAPLELKIRMLRAEVLETMLYGSASRGARARATTTHCAGPTRGS